MPGAEAESPLEDTELPIDRGRFSLLRFARGLVLPDIGGPEIGSPHFAQPWPQMKFQATAKVVDAALTGVAIVGHH